MIIAEGMRVAAFGRVVADTSGEILWVAPAWGDPAREIRLAGGDIRLERDDPDVPLPSGLVRVEGRWTAGNIFGASVRTAKAIQTAKLPRDPDAMSIDGLSPDDAARVITNLTCGSGAVSLGSGGDKSGFSLHVLFLTPELVARHNRLTFPVDISASIAPVEDFAIDVLTPTRR